MSIWTMLHALSTVVLHHGLWVRPGPVSTQYWHGIDQALAAQGYDVLVTEVHRSAGVATRAAQLRQQIVRHLNRFDREHEKVAIIAHGVGGLDARFAVSRLGLGERVSALCTVGTPHRGTAFADWGVKQFGRLVAPFFHLLGVSYDAFLDLTTAACKRFNETVPDAPGVRYLAVAGVCETQLMGPEWWLPHAIVNRAEGPNDGVVSVASARWGEHTDVWAGDHLNLINWPNRFARRRGLWASLAPDYGRIVRRIAEAG